MTAYSAPLQDMRFVLNEVADMAGIAQLPGFEEASSDLVEAVLEEAGKLAAEVLAPLNHSGDQAGSIYENGVVRTPAGFREAYRQFAEGGWNALAGDPDYGGQGLPWTLNMATQELWNAANMSMALCPLLSQGAAELLQAHGSADQKDTYLTRILSGEWTGTMNLTEPHAGSDVGAVKTRAEPAADGAYLITGQKIYITFGEHDLTENIVHMVLARTPGAPAGTRGISLFIVPKFLINDDGSLGPRNDLRCVSIEHKLGIKASPTAVMAYGDSGGAEGYLVGEENRGMEYMFTMMNSERLLVGVQGLAIAERAYQQAVAYARERRQGRALGAKDPAPVAIIEHPDVRRMLMTMRSQIEAMRCLIYVTAAVLDRAARAPDEAERARSQAEVDLLIPVAKAWCSDLGCEVASLGIQVHGGMGFVEETGAAQHYRDARIAPIYEGTNGIQALDLLGRKMLRDDGAALTALTERMHKTLTELEAFKEKDITAIRGALGEGIMTLEAAGDFLIETGKDSIERAAAGATPFLRLLGIVAGGWLLAKGAAAAARQLSASGNGAANGAADGHDPDFLKAKLITARFYGENVMPQVAGLASQVITGADSTLALEEARF